MPRPWADRPVLAARRYAQLYGPGTCYEADPPPPPRVHVDDAARQTVPALDVPLGVTLVADDRAAPTA